MRRTPTLNCALLALSCLFNGLTASAQEVGIGQWRDHFPYQNLLAVAQGGGQIYAASSTAMFQYGASTGELTNLNKTNALNDVGIQGLAWNEALATMVVYYQNGNIDLLKNNTSVNIGDIKRSSVIGDKGVYNAYMDGTIAYLACGFGIVVLDLANEEIRETWFIGPSGSKVQVNAITMTPDSIYAATASGLFVANRFSSNLASFTNWHKRVDMGTALDDGPFSEVVRLGDRLLLSVVIPGTGGDTLLVLGQDNTWSRETSSFGQVIKDMTVTADGQYVVLSHITDIRVLDQQLNPQTLIYSINGKFTKPQQAIRDAEGFVWIADAEQGLIRAQDTEVGSSIVPNGPKTASAWRMAADNGTLYVATGAVSGIWDSRFQKDGIHMRKNGQWSTMDRSTSTLLDLGANEFGGSVNDPICVAIDPNDPTHAFVGSWDEGLIEIKDGAPVQIYNHTNSALSEDVNPYQGALFVSGLDYDDAGNLWITNPRCNDPVVVLTTNGEWLHFSPGNLLGSNLLLGDMVAAQNGYKWMVRPRGNGILVYNNGNTIADTGDDQYKLLNAQTGTGGLPTNDVYCLAEDIDGQMWVGTAQGVAIFYSPDAIFNGDDYDAQQILIEQDGNVQILLETESVISIAVDGANRKWIGTQGSGVYLISADGRDQIHHFTDANSPLPSNTITNIAIDGSTGEVYMATESGIMSYRSDATTGENDNTCATVFPNPVRETYTGPIAITGLVRTSEVKITDVSGNLVYRTTSTGGQAIWNGNDMNGNRASTGVYLVLVSDPSGSYKCNTKLLLAR
ncbi:MAG: T9SS type A sorting domain-containing protein [Flavobacteriales bacterium]|nr:T9SS type A sorting domain-containing protein [Flavobacteriales bacterium]